MSSESDFLRNPDTIANRLPAAIGEVDDVDCRYSTQGWDTVTKLAWRPAWSIRSRRGSLKAIWTGWRDRRHS